MVRYSCWNGPIGQKNAGSDIPNELDSLPLLDSVTVQYSSCYHKDNAVDLVMVRVLSRSYRVACPDSNFEGHEACYVF